MEIPRSLLARSDITPGEKLTLVGLYLYANRNQSQVWPSNRKLAADTAMDYDTTRRNLKRLEALGIIEKDASGPIRRVVLPTVTHKRALGSIAPPPGIIDPTLGSIAPPPWDHRSHPPGIDSRKPHLMNHPVNQPIESESKTLGSAPVQIDIHGADDPGPPEAPKLEPLWARHGILRSEALANLRKPATRLKLTKHVRKLLTALVASGYDEPALIAAWSQARNEAITAQSMEWFNGSTELRPDNVQRLSGRYLGADADEARENRRKVIGGNRGWGTAIVAESSSLSRESEDKETEWNRRKNAAQAEWEILMFAQARDILAPYGITNWHDYAVQWDKVGERDHERIAGLPEIQAPDPRSEHYD